MANLKKIFSIILKIPLWLLISASMIGSIYAAYNKIQGIGWGTPIIMGIIIILYGIGWYLGKIADNSDTV